MRLPLILTAAAVTLAACARSPDAIAPVPMPAGMFATTSCAAARAEQAATTARLTALSAQQQSAVTGDALGVFLIGVPVSSLTGADQEGLIATEKGKLLALNARLAGCA